MKSAKELWWLMRYTLEFRRRTKWNWRECWQSAEAGLENAENDTTECPIDWVSEEISCWGD